MPEPPRLGWRILVPSAAVLLLVVAAVGESGVRTLERVLTESER